MKRLIIIIIVGLPCSGKGTHGKRLALKYGLIHLNMGDRLRALAAEGKLDADSMRKMEKGLLIDDEKVNHIFRYMMTEYPDAKGFVVDGFPRTLRQAEYFDTILADITYAKIIFVHVRIPEKIARQRMFGRNREDDRLEEVQSTRIDEYNNKTGNALFYYYDHASIKLIVEVDGQGPKEEVFDKICKNIDDCLIIEKNKA